MSSFNAASDGRIDAKRVHAQLLSFGALGDQLRGAVIPAVVKQGEHIGLGREPCELHVRAIMAIQELGSRRMPRGSCDKKIRYLSSS